VYLELDGLRGIAIPNRDREALMGSIVSGLRALVDDFCGSSFSGAKRRRPVPGPYRLLLGANLLATVRGGLLLPLLHCAEHVARFALYYCFLLSFSGRSADTRP